MIGEKNRSNINVIYAKINKLNNQYHSEYLKINFKQALIYSLFIPFILKHPHPRSHLNTESHKMKVLWQVLWTFILIPSYALCACVYVCFDFQYTYKAILKSSNQK